jgi:hypothetical protein
MTLLRHPVDDPARTSKPIRQPVPSRESSRAHLTAESCRSVFAERPAHS